MSEEIYKKTLYKIWHRVEAIKDYCELHINRRSQSDVQYISAIEDSCNDILNILKDVIKKES